MARKTSADIRVDLAELTDTMQALLDVAKDEDRDLDADETQHFEELSGKVQACKQELAAAEKFEATKRELAEIRSLQTQPTAPIGGLGVRGSAERSSNAQHRIGPLRAFSGPNAARDAFDCGQWLKAIVARGNRMVNEDAEARIATRGWDIRNVATEGSPSGGGYLVPTPLSNAIIDVRAMAGISRQVARVVPMTSETQEIAKKAAGTTVYYVGEAQAITPSDQVWEQLLLTAKKRAILSYVSQELKDDAIINVMDDLASQMGTDFAVKEDAEFINGDGTGTYGGEVGLLSAIGSAGVATAATGHDTWPELDAADFSAAMGLLPDRFWQYRPSWITSAGFYHSTMVRIMAAGGGNTMATIEQGAGSRPLFLGYPVYFTNQLPTATAAATVTALFGAFSQAVIIGDRTGVRIAQSEHAGFENDTLAIRATTRYDILVHEPGDATNPGAYVALKTAS